VLADGRFDEAEPLIEEALALGRRAQHPGAILTANGLALFLAHERGRSQEFSQRFELFTDHYPWARTLLRVGFALYCTEVGRTEDAQRELEALAAGDFRDFPRDEHWILTMAQLAAICFDVGDEKRAAQLYELLRPFAGRNAVHDLLRVSAGCVDHYLGLLAVTTRRWPDAVRHFEDALAMNTRMGARPFVVRTQYEYAQLLRARGRREDLRRARAFATECAAAAKAMGMQRALDLALELERALEQAAPAAHPRSKA
jgi:tetratricopeptide (TPR) repeat protein